MTQNKSNIHLDKRYVFTFGGRLQLIKYFNKTKNPVVTNYTIVHSASVCLCDKGTRNNKTVAGI